MNEKTKSSFMIVSYAELDVPPVGQCCFFIDKANHTHQYQASTVWSNSGVPGQFIFQLNTVEKHHANKMIGTKY
jgi:hypothetical protein